jgi:hypothetical protein
VTLCDQFDKGTEGTTVVAHEVVVNRHDKPGTGFNRDLGGLRRAEVSDNVASFPLLVSPVDRQ